MSSIASASSIPIATASAPSSTAGVESRIAAFDGLRGLLAFLVCISHYFGEVPHGISGLMLGWIAVKAFFVLSGFLIAKILIENLDKPGFLPRFYIRRACRTLPVYLVTILVAFACVALFSDRAWIEAERFMPLWSYLTFTQPLVMIARDDFGTHWLLPTWTLTVEEQFYLLAPLICLLTPRRYLVHALVAGLVFSLGFRAVVYGTQVLPAKAALVTLPAACHAMFFGMLAAVLIKAPNIDWARWDLPLRWSPVAIACVVLAMQSASKVAGGWADNFGVPLVALGAACYLASIARGSPEAQSLLSPVLKRLGRISYSLYLMHMPVLGLAHGLILSAKPDIATPVQLLVTLLCVPLSIAVAWASAKWIEEPMIALGRRWTRG